MNITVLGSTGSIGTQTLEVAEAIGAKITALTAFRNIKLLELQARKFRPRVAVIADESRYNDLKIALADTNIKVAAGEASIVEASAVKVDRVVNALVGISGLLPTEAAIKAGNDVALANKETLVAGGEYIMKLARNNGVRVLPVDSEHSAIFQSLQGCHDKNEIKKILLTCSGGAFFGRTDLSGITPDDIYNPNWDMGKKVTLDSATLANKGLEFIEAVRLFGVSPEQIEVVIHRESLLHSAVEFIDGAIIAQIGAPDMHVPIGFALAYPNRAAIPSKKLSLSEIGSMTFAKPDYDTFTALSGFMSAMKKGGGYTAIANAVNDAAGALFLDGKISFTRIGELICEAVETFPEMNAENTSDIMIADWAGTEFVKRKTRKSNI
ncbi:MAG: 1-deoxy-D-xylulose-5-phosphate reductoisomerase [Ruminococcus sp.]|jgi:1-deoxy-D-xylulose-5-phosphate reductoisomerase|nr:1-deoxy-D-xylulose-5-phosphate reductoisomerase [Ruminococcus sp.]